METATSRNPEPANAAPVPADTTTGSAVDGQSTMTTEPGENPKEAVNRQSTGTACSSTASAAGIPVPAGSTTTTQAESCTPVSRPNCGETSNSESKGQTTTMDDTSETTSYEALFEKLGNKGATIAKGTIGGTAAAPVPPAAQFSSSQTTTKHMFPHAFGSVPTVAPATLTATMTISSQKSEAAILPAPTTSSVGAESTTHTQVVPSNAAVVVPGGVHSSMSSLNGTAVALSSMLVTKNQTPGIEQLSNNDPNAVRFLNGL